MRLLWLLLFSVSITNANALASKNFALLGFNNEFSTKVRHKLFADNHEEKPQHIGNNLEYIHLLDYMDYKDSFFNFFSASVGESELGINIGKLKIYAALFGLDYSLGLKKSPDILRDGNDGVYWNPEINFVIFILKIGGGTYIQAQPDSEREKGSPYYSASFFLPFSF